MINTHKHHFLRSVCFFRTNPKPNRSIGTGREQAPARDENKHFPDHFVKQGKYALSDTHTPSGVK